MIHCARSLVRLLPIPILLLLLTAAPAMSQVPGVGVFAETACDGITVDVTVTFTVYDTVPADIVGWVLEREMVGECVPLVVVEGQQPLPTTLGQHQFVLQDHPQFWQRKTVYRVWAVTDTGAREFISWPQRTSFTQAECTGAAPAWRGMLVENGGWPYLEACPDECWWELSRFDGSLPVDQDPPPYGVTIDIHGELFAGMEGPYIGATSWVESPEPCDAVPDGPVSWGELKARYR